MFRCCLILCFHRDLLRGAKLAYLVQCGEATRVIHKAQAPWVDVIHCRFVLETEQVGKEGAHLAGSENQYLHNGDKISASRTEMQISTSECNGKVYFSIAERGRNSTKLNLFAIFRAVA